jgi:hypothetical protein
MKEGAFGRRESVKIVGEFDRLNCSPYSDLEFLLYLVVAIFQCLLVLFFIVVSEARFTLFMLPCITLLLESL